MKKFIAILCVLCMLLSLAGCAQTGGGKDGTDQGQKQSADSGEKKDDAGQSQKQGEEQKSDKPAWVKDENSVEGTVTIYTTSNETEMQLIQGMFQTYYPKAKLEFVTGSMGELTARLRSEKNKPQCDVLWGGVMQSDGDIYHDLFEKYTSVNEKDAKYTDPDGYYTYYGVQYLCLIVNTQLRNELGIEIKGYEDLLNEKLEGKIILADPSASSSGWRQLTTMLRLMGGFDTDTSWDYIKKLVKQCKGVITTSSSTVYNNVMNGENVVGLTYESAAMNLLNDQAENIEIVYMKEGNTGVAYGCAKVKDCKNAAGAEAFIDLTSSAEYQDARAQATQASRQVNKNATYKVENMKPVEELGLQELDFKYLSQNREDILKKWNEIWSTQN